MNFSERAKVHAQQKSCAHTKKKLNIIPSISKQANHDEYLDMVIGISYYGNNEANYFSDFLLR